MTGPLPELVTERLVLRPVRAGDGAAVHRYAGDPDITMMLWLPNDTLEETEAFVEENAAEWESPDQTDFEFVILYEGEIVGGCDCDLGRSPDRSYATLGWIVRKDFRSRGNASEAASALLDFAFGLPGVGKVYAQCDVRNAASYGVMRKIGMRLVDDKGTRTYPKTGITSGEYTCLITRGEWENGRTGRRRE